MAIDDSRFNVCVGRERRRTDKDHSLHRRAGFGPVKPVWSLLDDIYLPVAALAFSPTPAFASLWLTTALWLSKMLHGASSADGCVLEMD